MSFEATGNQIIFKKIYTELCLLCSVFHQKNRSHFPIQYEVLHLCLMPSVEMYEYELRVTEFETVPLLTSVTVQLQSWCYLPDSMQPMSAFCTQIQNRDTKLLIGVYQQMSSILMVLSPGFLVDIHRPHSA